MHEMKWHEKSHIPLVLVHRGNKGWMGLFYDVTSLPALNSKPTNVKVMLPVICFMFFLNTKNKMKGGQINMYTCTNSFLISCAKIVLLLLFFVLSSRSNRAWIWDLWKSSRCDNNKQTENLCGGKTTDFGFYSVSEQSGLFQSWQRAQVTICSIMQ